MYKNNEDRQAPWLGFQKIEFTPIVDSQGDKTVEGCTQRQEDDDTCNQMYLERCVWADLEGLDKGDFGGRKQASCAWATSTNPDDDTYNCNEYGRYFQGPHRINDYHSELVDASGGELEAD